MEIKEIFESTSKTTDSSKKQNQMLTKVKAAAKKTDNLPLPKKGSDYRKLYDANSQLVVGSEKCRSQSSKKNQLSFNTFKPRASATRTRNPTPSPKRKTNRYLPKD